MLSLLIYLVVVLLVTGLLLWAIGALPFLDPAVKQMIRVLIIVVACLFCLVVLLQGFGLAHFPPLR